MFDDSDDNFEDKLLEIAQESLDRKEFQTAINIFAQIASEDPDNDNVIRARKNLMKAKKELIDHLVLLDRN